MLNRKNFIILLTICILIFLLYLIKIPGLILEDTTISKLIFIDKVSINDEFTMKWIHSVELQPWEEIFKVDKDYNVILDRIRLKSFGAGVPDQIGRKTEIKDGYIIFSEIEKQMPYLSYGISQFARHTFYFKNKELKLYQLVNKDDYVNIYVKKLSAFDYIMLKSKMLLSI